MGKRPFRILVVEDEPDLTQFMEDFCKINGYEADFAPNGAVGLKCLETGTSYGLAVVDFLMPQMHGVDFILHAKKKWPELPIIAVSAFDDVEIPFRESGAYLFLKKPFDPYVLETEVALLAAKAGM